MATIVLSAVGYSLGASFGGAVLGISSAIIGRAVGATLGRAIDQRLMGAGSQAVETGRVDRFRIMGASEGTPITQVYGRMRVPGQVIWSSRFKEDKTTTRSGGKGAPKGPSVTSYSYTVSAAVAVCEGEITRIGRVWADGVEQSTESLNMRVYKGHADQMPDPKMEAVEGAGNVPAYRGIAYVVFEDLPLAGFGNRFPQFTFEVVRPAQEGAVNAVDDPVNAIEGVALIPGTGEYSLATTPVHFEHGLGQNVSVNVNSPSGRTDFVTSMEAMRDELPLCKSVSMVVSWFGDDLRSNACQLKPKVEQREVDGVGMPWKVSGVVRAQADEIAKVDDRTIYGGTPTDQSVIEAIGDINEAGQSVVFYPFILMDQIAGNGLPNPYAPNSEQPALPWRGRITTSVAPTKSGSPDKTAAAEAEVAQFFGDAMASDFQQSATGVVYTGADDWGYRRFILHYAHLCAVAGGVSGFCVGSEMRGLTQIRGAGGSFPAVEQLISLAAEVRSILGPVTKIGYAADWSEYFGYHPQDGSGDLLFHLDPLWASDDIDFIGIDNYMPLSDWRDGQDHLDADWGSIYNLDYLKSNIEGGEGYDWYYHSREARAAQIRTSISDGAHDEPWVWRYKDIRNWWSNPHHNRLGGVRQAQPTAWQPASKPIWFTEIGCAAVDKATNQPNKFVDVKSSESSLPNHSDGTRDDLIQMQYLRAMYSYWNSSENNPVSDETGVQMIDMKRTHVWAWDARPYPYFPNARGIWSDGENYGRGHWINGRTGARSLSSVVGEICERSGVVDYDTSALFGYVRGYQVADIAGARAALQPLMLAYGFEAIERDGTLVFKSRSGLADMTVDTEKLAMLPDQEALIQSSRAPSAEVAGRIRLTYVENDGAFEVRATEAIHPDEASFTVSQSEIPLALTQAEARAIVERWLAESRVARDTVRVAMPMSDMKIGAGDVLKFANDEGGETLYRIDNVEQSGAQLMDAVRVEHEIYTPSDATEESVGVREFTAPVPVFPLFMDLPLLTGDEVAHAPYVAVTARPWPGSLAVYGASEDAGYALNTLVGRSSIIGKTQNALRAALSGVPDRGDGLRVQIYGGDLSSTSWEGLLSGKNLAAIGDPENDVWEVFQFAEASLVEKGVYELSLRLRGQLGTDGTMPAEWPSGSYVVMLDGNPEQIDLTSASRGLVRHFRIGPSKRPYDDPSYVHKAQAFQGVGLRPYAPVHLRAQEMDGDIELSWIRRTRYDGDSWDGFDVPLNEESERYVVRVMRGGSVLREVITSEPQYTYSATQIAQDAVSAPYAIEVAQVSQRFGAGPFRRIDIND
ncbi:glycoside hydrolase/phage tail family protein [Falsihalocynthiibacter sp. SS001]|uniref:baseplate multidomain protein megatron n=1 Tax=Falsihalocynthiibacter sp. SS001 TaxID=3349698 RepID=UPI0036D2B45C